MAENQTGFFAAFLQIEMDPELSQLFGSQVARPTWEVGQSGKLTSCLVKLSSLLKLEVGGLEAAE